MACAPRIQPRAFSAQEPHDHRPEGYTGVIGVILGYIIGVILGYIFGVILGYIMGVILGYIIGGYIGIMVQNSNL